MNTASVIITVFLAAAVITAIFFTVKKKGGCNGKCNNCPYNQNCKDKK